MYFSMYLYHPPSITFFRTFKKSTAPYQVHNVRLRYIHFTTIVGLISKRGDAFLRKFLHSSILCEALNNYVPTQDGDVRKTDLNCFHSEESSSLDRWEIMHNGGKSRILLAVHYLKYKRLYGSLSVIVSSVCCCGTLLYSLLWARRLVAQLRLCISKNDLAKSLISNWIFPKQNYNVLSGVWIFCREVRYYMQPFRCQHREQNISKRK
jgi:hypothetical protein